MGRAIIGALKATHFLPTLTVTTLSLALALRTSTLETALAIALTVFSGQMIVGWSNDLIDYHDDEFHHRIQKPLVAGFITTKSIKLLILLDLLLLMTLTLVGPLAGLYGLLHLLAVASAIFYNTTLKSTVLSFLPYIFSFGLLPVVILGATEFSYRPWVALIGACFGFGVHCANVFKDIEEDQSSGILGLPQRMGVKYSRIATFLALGGGAFTLFLATSSATSLMLVLAAMAFLLPLPRNVIFPYSILLGLAVMALFITSISK